MTSSSLPRLGRFAPLVGALAIAACDIPSEPPIFQQTWLVPADSVQVSVAELLPADVALTGGGTAFTATTPTANFSTTLANLCGQPECQVPGDVVVPNTPAFASAAGELTASIALPAGVTGVTVSGGFLQFSVTNNLGFDPMRPNGANTAPYGSIAFQITSGTLNQTVTFTGQPTGGLVSGAMTTFSIPLPTGTYSNSITVDIRVTAPQGGSATINSTNTVSVAASIGSLAISSASIVVNAKPISNTPEEFDLEDVDLGDLVEGGGVVLTIVNPFNATANMSLTFAAPPQGGQPAVNIVKGFNMAANATSVVNLTMLKSELEQLLGRSGVTVTVNGSATGTGPGNTVTVTPTSTITVRNQLSLTLNVGA